MTHTTEQERAEFEAWYIAGARKAVPAFAEWSEIEIREGCMRPDSGSYRIDSARIAWDAWQAARRAPAAPQAVPISDELPQGFISDVLTAAGLVRHGKQCKGLADRLGGAVEKIWTTSIAQRKAIAAAPQPPEAALVPSIAVTPEMVEAANEAYCPFGDMELALCAALQVAPIPPGAAPVQMPTPDGYIMDSLPNGRLEYKRGPLSQMDSICNSTMPVYEYGTVRQLLADHGIQEQST